MRTRLPTVRQCALPPLRPRGFQLTVPNKITFVTLTTRPFLGAAIAVIGEGIRKVHNEEEGRGSAGAGLYFLFQGFVFLKGAQGGFGILGFHILWDVPVGDRGFQAAENLLGYQGYGIGTLIRNLHKKFKGTPTRAQMRDP